MRFKSLEEQVAYQMTHPHSKRDFSRVGPILDNIVKWIAIAAVVAGGVHYVAKGKAKTDLYGLRQKLLASQLISEGRESFNWLKDELRPRTAAEKARQEEVCAENRKRIQEYREMGIDPVVKYAQPGTKEYQEALQFYREEFGSKRY